jgi:AcrR family transcriptional regulator
VVSNKRAGVAKPLTADLVVEVAGRIVDEQGIGSLTMRRLSEELGVAVTSIYWHVGNREDLLEALVDRLLAEMGTLRAIGETPRERIASLARQLRKKLLERPHLIALAHEQSKTPLMFQPVQAAIAAELAALGQRGEAAALFLRALQVHVVSSVLLERTIERYPTGQPADFDPAAWLGDSDDTELVAALGREVDRSELFEFALQALLGALPRDGA